VVVARSFGRANNRAIYIQDDGNIGIQDNGTFRYNCNILHPLTEDNCGGIRSALWLNLEFDSLLLEEKRKQLV